MASLRLTVYVGHLLWNNLLGAHLPKKSLVCPSSNLKKPKEELWVDNSCHVLFLQTNHWSLGKGELWLALFGTSLTLRSSVGSLSIKDQGPNITTKGNCCEPRRYSNFGYLILIKKAKIYIFKFMQFFIVSLRKLIWMKQKRLLLQLWSGPNFSVSVGGCFYVTA